MSEITPPTHPGAHPQPFLAPDIDDGTQSKPPDAKTVSQPDLTASAPYSIFTTPQKRLIVLLASVAGAFSTLCSYIYYPALAPIATELRASVALVNLTVTSYLVVAAVAPAVMGDIADRSGRRPVYGLMFALFIGANVGIAVQGTFPGLLVLRMVQSGGSSGKSDSGETGVVGMGDADTEFCDQG